MLEMLILTAVVAALIRYVWVSWHREVTEERETSVAEALDSLRAALPIEVRSTDFTALAEADKQVSDRPRVRFPSPLPTINQGTSK